MSFQFQQIPTSETLHPIRGRDGMKNCFSCLPFLESGSILFFFFFPEIILESILLFGYYAVFCAKNVQVTV